MYDNEIIFLQVFIKNEYKIKTRHLRHLRHCYHSISYITISLSYHFHCLDITP